MWARQDSNTPAHRRFSPPRYAPGYAPGGRPAPTADAGLLSRGYESGVPAGQERRHGEGPLRHRDGDRCQAGQVASADRQDNKTGRLAKVDMTEWPPKEPAVDGTTYVFKRGEEAEADHPAVLHKPYAFVAVDEK